MYVIISSFIIFAILIEGMSVQRYTKRIELQPKQIGISTSLVVHQYNVNNKINSQPQTAYIQASLHADEIPGLLVNHHLIKLLDEAAKSGRILNNIHICAYANPIGLSQSILGYHIGRFSLDSGINFNREWPDISNSVITQVRSKLIRGDPKHNVKVIRQAMSDVLDNECKVYKLDKVLKKELFKMAAVADIVLDLHCDNNAVVHMYAHEHLWHKAKDLAADIGARCALVATDTIGIFSLFIYIYIYIYGFIAHVYISLVMYTYVSFNPMICIYILYLYPLY
jgi:predicted deacylase